MLLRGVKTDLWDLSFRELMNLTHAYIIALTPESVSMAQALDGDEENVEQDVQDSLSGDEPADVALARNRERPLSIADAIAAGGLGMLDDLRSQMEAGVTNPLG
jgi:hypothetical protein